MQEDKLVEMKNHLSDLQYELEKSRSKETKLERSLADAVAKLESDRLKLQANDIKQDPDSNSTNANNNSILISETKVNESFLFSQSYSFVLFFFLIVR